MSQETKKENIVDKVINFALSDNPIKWILVLMILGLILRLLIANNIGFLGDEMVHGPAAVGILKTGVLSRMTQSIVWFYLTDMVQQLFGVTGITSRFLSVIFGVLCIPLVYWLGKKFYDIKTGLMAAFFITISAFVLRFTLIEMDIACVFFVLIALVFLVKGWEKGKLSYLSIFFLGIGAMIKSSAYFFIPVFLIWFYWNQEKPVARVLLDKKKLLAWVLIAVLMYSPIIAYNYFLYQDKGIVDVYFSKFFDINREAYAYQSGIDSSFSLNDLIFGGAGMFKDIIYLDPMIMILGLAGVFFWFKENETRRKNSIFVLCALIPFAILASSVLLQTHFTIIMPFMCILAAFCVKKITENFSRKQIVYIIIIISLIVTLYLMHSYLTSQASVIKVKNFANTQISDTDLVIVDGRIYTGRTAWLFYDKQYLSSAFLPQILETLKNYSSKEITTTAYYIECASDDCGWGTIRDQPDFNQSMEYLQQQVIQNMALVASYNGGGGYDESLGQPTMRIYKGTIMVKPEIFIMARQTHSWWGYSVNYQTESYDTYKLHSGFDKFLNFLAHIILYTEILFAILAIAIPFYWLYKEAK